MSKPFKLPAAFISQLKEFTNGFHLVIVNGANDFETHVWHPDKLTEMGLLNYVDIQSTSIQEIIRQQTIDRQLSTEDEEGETT